MVVVAKGSHFLVMLLLPRGHTTKQRLQLTYGVQKLLPTVIVIGHSGGGGGGGDNLFQGRIEGIFFFRLWCSGGGRPLWPLSYRIPFVALLYRRRTTAVGCGGKWWW